MWKHGLTFFSGGASVFLYHKFKHETPSPKEPKSDIPDMLLPFAMQPKQEQGSVAVMTQGFPSTVNIIPKPNFVISYDRQKRQPHWVMEKIIKEQISVTDNSSRDESNFYPENTVHKYFQSQNEDYRKSGFDRGHLAAAANHRHSQQTMDSTFTLANVCPQAPGLNRGIWSKLEQYTRAMARVVMC